MIKMIDLNKQMYKRLCEDFKKKGIFIENGIMKNVFGTPRLSVDDTIIYLTTISGKEKFSVDILGFKIEDFQKVIDTVMTLYEIAQKYGDGENYRYVKVNSQTAKKIVNQYIKSRKISPKPAIKCTERSCCVKLPIGAIYLKIQYDSKTKKYVVDTFENFPGDTAPIPVEEYLDKYL